MRNYRVMWTLVAVVLVPQGCVQKTTESDILRTKLLCAEKGREFVEDAKQRMDPRGAIYDERYTFNTKLNTCLVYHVFRAEGVAHHTIIDLSTNEHVYSFFDLFNDETAKNNFKRECEKGENKPSECLSREEFAAKLDDLFKQ